MLLGEWRCKKCHRTGGLFWAALHSHHKLTTHPGLDRRARRFWK
jgi:hypothetical protein